MNDEARSRKEVYLLFAIVVLSSALGNLSQTSVNAMLADIGDTFGASVGLLQWLATSYMLVLGITVPASAYLERRFNMRTQVLLAQGLFLAGCVADFVAPSFGVLLAGRVLQAVGAGMLLPLMQTIAIRRFPAGRQATAMGIAGIALGFAPNIGPTLGGAVSFQWGWQSFFVLLGALTAALVVWTLFAVPRSDHFDRTARLDVTSLAQSTLGFGGLLLGFSNASSFSLADPMVWGPVAFGAAFLAVFVRRQRHVPDPLVSMDIFKDSQFTRGFIGQSLLTASFMGITLVVPLYVQGLCGGSALEAGLVLLPGTVAALVINPVGGVLTDRIGVRPVGLIFGAFLAAGAVSMAFVDASTPLWLVMAMQGVRACGVSGLIGPLTSWSLGALQGPLVASGSSFCIVVRQACASFGTSVMVFAITAVGATAAGAAHPALPYQLAFGFSAAVAVALLAFIVAKVR